MLSNAYFLAKFRFDTAENEPSKNLQNFADPNPLTPSFIQTFVMSVSVLFKYSARVTWARFIGGIDPDGWVVEG